MDMPLDDLRGVATPEEWQLELFAGGDGHGNDDRPAASYAPRHWVHRYYFTIVPPPALAQDIERGAMLIARRYGARHATRADRLHASLNGVWHGRDKAEETLIEDALEVGAAVRRPSFNVAFDKLQTFNGASRSKTGGRSVVPTVLTASDGAREVLALYADIRREMQRFGMPVGPKSFVPHLTIWYGPQRIPDIMLKRPFRWAVRKFWLVHTATGMKRPDYIGEWPLG